ncbi:M20 family metallopeptidase [Acuticoccus sp. MNP-M23]|uniref:M20 family metallopeptidase n=1 Tax=Acuticoccus sp. MNP-M23 TaxID=3072793 RepID=UPI0028149771|nr:M20 family metallopeptidase [Acuticoccus sp. MNP-M23]WMS44005.1 M20 family metallopeptidase [Acuticoccus sp. MNP-M23]
MSLLAETTLSELEANVLARITEKRWLALAADLIRTGQPRAGNPLDPDLPGGEEEAIAMMVAGKLEALGMQVETPAAVPHRPNVVGRLGGTGTGPSLMINDHLDTYPVVEPEKWDKTGFDPYAATRDGDRLYARGTSDTRGNMASCLLAAQALVESGVSFEGDLIYCFCVDEERDGTLGSIWLTQELGLTADYSITAEPTAWGGPVEPDATSGESWGMNLSVANSGHCLVEVTVSGEKSHIWRPDVALNPIVEAAPLLTALKEMAFTHDADPFPGHTPPCTTVVRIRGGLAGEMQFSPDTCTITLAVVGIVPGMTMASVIADIETTARDAFGGSNRIAFGIKQVPGSLFVEATPPVPLDEEPCVSLTRAYGRIVGGTPEPNRKNAFNDTIRLREAGINAVTLGPGEDGWAPDNEWISIEKSVKAAQIYALTIMDILKVRQ